MPDDRMSRAGGSPLPAHDCGKDAMFFNTALYLVFFFGVFTLYWLLPWARARVYLLVGASFYFYYSWSAQLAFLVTATTVMDYLLARAMDSTHKQRLRKLLLLASIFVNVGILCYFKYMNFFLDSLNEAFGGVKTMMQETGPDGKVHIVGQVLNGLNGFFGSMGMEPSFVLREIIVPFGISFYTFEAISYTVDVYSRKIKAERNLPNFMLFILFFPHLVSGPIVRGSDFLPQTHRKKRWDWLRMQLGVQIFLIGFFKKVIADRMGLFQTPVFDNPESYGTGATWLAVFAFAMRIYCDFSGYTDMAIGSAHMLGYKLKQNFFMPYLSKNVGEFWRRWHISLSTWIRDYLFIPLGGSRGGKWFVARNLMITMTIGGLWHGASWNFIIWGVLHGAMLVTHRFFRDFVVVRPRLDGALQTWLGTAFRMSLTFFCVMMCWTFFHKGTLSDTMTMFEHMFTATISTRPMDLPNRSLWYLFAVIVVAHWVGSSPAAKRLYWRTPAPVLGMANAALLTIGLVLMPETDNAFIYFDF